MVDLRKMQRDVYQNKVDHAFNTTDVALEFCLLYGEVGEAWHAYSHGEQRELAEELADVAIYLMGIAQITGVDLEKEILAKMEKNRRRKYVPLANGTLVKADDEIPPEGTEQ